MITVENIALQFVVTCDQFRNKSKIIFAIKKLYEQSPLSKNHFPSNYVPKSQLIKCIYSNSEF